MKRPLRVRFWIEVALAGFSTASLALTAVWPQWIEHLLGLEPDGGDGSAEWGWVLALGTSTVVCVAAARQTWQRHVTAR